MDCKRASSLIMDYFDRNMDAMGQRDLDLHLKQCSLCRRDFQWMKEAIEGVESIQDWQAPEDFEIGIFKEIDLQYYRRQKPIYKSRVGMWAAASLYFAFLSIFFYLKYGTMHWETKIIALMKFVDLGNRIYGLWGLIGKVFGKIG
ncbi:anti-sigma factor family protein [Thermotalea metallivorans]|uniref:Putative zinc-finger domain-containing protein n=1 Tax=Thermotalea metallivorans TaxID=520762 RepID=A0A140L531_9FIRM|nr:zf-HC2 domain-containing protein [Thermotalea metallivorans]KXG75656.1 hypothetical protein AN619_16520 [Thermotalea metallivorans]